MKHEFVATKAGNHQITVEESEVGEAPGDELFELSAL